MKKWLCSFVLTIVLCFGCSILAFANPYPNYNYYNSASDYQVACTWYAWQQAYDRLGISLPSTWGNAGSWYSNATGYERGGTARANSIACWSFTNSPPYGHVAYVTGVNGDGSINIVEGGSAWGGNVHGVCSRKVSPGTYWPDLGFIYLQKPDAKVSFSSWENANYTYIGSTDASIGQEIIISSGTCTRTGMYLYDKNGKYLAEAGQDTYYSKIYFKINEECGYTLKAGTQYKYKFYAVVNGQKYESSMQTFTTVPLTVTFSPWENANYTYIKDYDASIGQEINISGGNCTETGMYLYNSSGAYLTKASQNTYYYRIYFKINEECGYTLNSGTIYKYKFYAVVDGNTFYSSLQSFKTTGPETVEPCKHASTILKKTVAATCLKSGYTGDTYCLDCGELVKKGTATKKLEHDFSNNTEYCRRGCGTANPNYSASEKPSSGSLASLDAVAKSLPENGDPAGSTFNILQLKSKKVKKTSVTLGWKAVPNAAGYVVYGAPCGSKYCKLTDTGGTSFTQSGLKKGTYYKYFVAAHDKNGNILAASKTVHIATSGGKKGNTKSVKLNKKKKTLKVGKTFKLKAKLKNGKLKVSKHRKVAYESDNPKVATVSKSGKVKAVGKGTCYVYAYAQNGVFAKCKVTVK